MLRAPSVVRRLRATVLWYSAILIVVTAITLIVALLFYQSQVAAARTAAFARLQPITAMKLREIFQWREDHFNAALSLSGSPYFVDAFATWLDDPQPAATEALRAGLLADNVGGDYTNVVLLDANKEERIRLYADAPALRCETTEALIDKALATGAVQLGDIERCVPDTAPQLVLVAPLIPAARNGGAPIGVALLFADLENKLYPLLQEWPIDTATAETLLVERDGDNVLFLNNLRHTTDAALNLRLPAIDPSLPAAAAVLGRRGSIDGEDYRGVQVLADIGAVARSDWRIVSKIDSAEVYATVTEQVPVLAAMTTGFIVLAASLLGAMIFGQRQNMYRQLYAVEHERAMTLAQFETLLDSAGDAILLIDADGHVRQANVKACEIYGYPLTALLDLQWLDLAVDSAAETATISQIMTQKSGSYESMHRRRDGTSLPVEVTLAAVALNDRRHMQAIVRDITQRKREEAYQARLAEELRVKNEELESIVYAASHDLRSPLVNIHGFSEWLQSALGDLRHMLNEADLPDALRIRMAPILEDRIPTALGFIQSSSAKMDGLIAGILRLSRLGRTEVIPAVVDMEQLIDSLNATLNFQIEQSGALVVRQPLPPCFADRNQMSQLFSNLLDNALKYRTPSRPLVITISGHNSDRYSVYSVADNGIGIANNEQSRVWEIFHRADPQATAAGEGLGLALCRRIAERNNGRIWLESSLGVGSTFFVRLPASPGALDLKTIQSAVEGDANAHSTAR